MAVKVAGMVEEDENRRFGAVRRWVRRRASAYQASVFGFTWTLTVTRVEEQTSTDDVQESADALVRASEVVALPMDIRPLARPGNPGLPARRH